jgi:predicted acyltransferase
VKEKFGLADEQTIILNKGKAMQNQRDLSLDAFRGLTVMLMIIVNIQGNGDAAYAALKHAEWNGLTFADLVFPWFLFIVGLSVPLALDRAQSNPPWPAVLRRALVLFALGVILSWLIRPVEFERIRWMGVLQRIAIVYLACAAVVLARPGWKWAAAIAALILALHSWLLFVTVEGVNSLTTGAGLNALLDQQLLPGRLLRKTWDPEGVLSTLPAIASGLIGVAVMRARTVKSACIIFGIIFGVGGTVLSQWIPINKALWTASFVLVTAGTGLLVWTLLSLVWGKIGGSAAARWAVLLGQTALTLYVIHMLLLALIVRKLPDGTRIWDWLFAKLADTGMSLPLASLLFALVAGAMCTAPLGWLKRKGWLIKA